MHPNLKKCALLALFVSSAAPAAGNWQDLAVGGGGYVRNVAIHSDGTLVGRTDTAGAFLYNGISWVQLVTNTSMPAAFVNADPTGTNRLNGAAGNGVFELQMAPTNSSIMYMAFDGYVYQSTNKGTTWTQTALAQNAAGMPS